MSAEQQYRRNRAAVLRALSRNAVEGVACCVCHAPKGVRCKSLIDGSERDAHENRKRDAGELEAQGLERLVAAITHPELDHLLEEDRFEDWLLAIDNLTPNPEGTTAP